MQTDVVRARRLRKMIQRAVVRRLIERKAEAGVIRRHARQIKAFKVAAVNMEHVIGAAQIVARTLFEYQDGMTALRHIFRKVGPGAGAADNNDIIGRFHEIHLRAFELRLL